MEQRLVFRRLFPSIQAHLAEEEITVIIGPRQVGKTTLVTQLKTGLMKKGIAASDVHYFNLDLISERAIFNQQADFLQFIKNRLFGQNKLYIFVDEVQRIENAGIFFKGIYDLHLPVKLVLTGSSSLEIRSKISESLTGRKRLFKLYPLDFAEYLSFVDKDLLPFLVQKDKFASEKLWTFLDEFIMFGGYPRIILEKNREKKLFYLEEIFTSYVEKDVISLLRIKDSFAFSQLVKILSCEIGSLLNLERISRELGVKSETVRHYIDILEQTFIAYRLTPFFHSPATEIRKMPKMYFLDTGIRNSAKQGRDFIFKTLFQTEDKGMLLENYLFSELVKSEIKDIHFWRTKDEAEVDFTVEKKGMLIPVEVKSRGGELPTLSRGFHSFIHRYQPKVGIMVRLNEQKTAKMVARTEIHALAPYEVVPFLSKL